MTLPRFVHGKKAKACIEAKFQQNRILSSRDSKIEGNLFFRSAEV
jgi:hypothetical protein